MSDPRVIRVAATQLESIDFDLDANVAKACKYIAEAAEKGCQLIGFSEVFIPGYPYWIWYIIQKLTYTLQSSSSYVP
jgi:predicted amidohydrolase